MWYRALQIRSEVFGVIYQRSHEERVFKILLKYCKSPQISNSRGGESLVIVSSRGRSIWKPLLLYVNEGKPSHLIQNTRA